MYSPLETLAFFETLGTSITTDELFEYIGEKTPPKNFEVYKNLIIWPGKNTQETYQKRLEQNKIEEEYTNFSKKYLKLCKWIPYIDSIFLCNNITLHNCDKNSDIDLFIITKKNRLFIARSLITLFLHMLGVRRHSSKIKKRFCLSFFISEESTNLNQLKVKPTDIYMDHWSKSLLPIFTGTAYKNFAQENNLNQKKSLLKKSFISKLLKKFLEKSLDLTIANFIEQKLQNWQLKRCLQKISKLERSHGNIVNKTTLKFHNLDRRQEYLEKWKSAVRSYEEHKK